MLSYNHFWKKIKIKRDLESLIKHWLFLFLYPPFSHTQTHQRTLRRRSFNGIFTISNRSLDSSSTPTSPTSSSPSPTEASMASSPSPTEASMAYLPSSSMASSPSSSPSPTEASMASSTEASIGDFLPNVRFFFWVNYGNLIRSFGLM